MLQNVLNRVEANQSAAVDRLMDYLTIPSVSTDPQYAPHCREAADWTAAQLRECGLAVTVHDTPGHPIVLARSDAAGPSAPRVLFYGHYDVQPPDPLDLWITPPFQPTIREGRLYARGASDDKGQVMCFIEALRAWKESGTPLPVNVTVLIEGEEECSSVSLESFLPAHRHELAADIALVSDTSMWQHGEPAITYALRGLLYFDVQLHGPSRDLHSGVYGGTIANPATQLVLTLGQLFDANHHVTIPGFYDDVLPVSPQEKHRWDALNFNESSYARSIGLSAVHGEAGFTTLERRWARPACDINGLYGGYMGKGAKTVIPSFAGAKVSFRLAPDQDPAKIEAAFRKFLADRTPPGCRWQIESFGGARAVIVPIDSPWIAPAARAVEIGCGKRPVLVREGATIPVVADFKHQLNLDTLLIGFGLNDDNLHSPNEKFDLINFRMGCLTHAALLHELAVAR
jgi:acetylornithine deacetylase/succinyl-diaminopimelate desuccinylase-like protein